MINTEDFAKRLQQVIDYYSDTASSFAEKIEVQRSSISHILSGRNKPSLDFVLKVLSTFPEVELYWLLNGVGKFPSEKKSEESITSEKSFISETESKTSSSIEKKIEKIADSNKTIERIVIFYSDGSFKNYQN